MPDPIKIRWGKRELTSEPRSGGSITMHRFKIGEDLLILNERGGLWTAALKESWRTWRIESSREFRDPQALVDSLRRFVKRCSR